ncbi:hypothetical protein RJT34_04005 [Clitoria ternatea]|uniref:Uncharacterized protein n=1 Tax=Clitoria ternatea TaxID=43366 RepID=A0AAN9KMP1_CLITE
MHAFKCSTTTTMTTTRHPTSCHTRDERKCIYNNHADPIQRLTSLLQPFKEKYFQSPNTSSPKFCVFHHSTSLIHSFFIFQFPSLFFTNPLGRVLGLSFF